jgi:hypothetical protein
MNQVHDLKIFEGYFEAKLKGLKPWELRIDDRGFAVGDTLRLREVRPVPYAARTVEYTGRVIVSEVKFIFRGCDGLSADYVVMSDRVECVLYDDPDGAEPKPETPGAELAPTVKPETPGTKLELEERPELAPTMKPETPGTDLTPAEQPETPGAELKL